MIVRLIKRLVGLDVVDYWRQRHEGTLALLADFQAKADEALSQKQSEAISHQENARRQAAGWASAQAELAALRRLLVFEQTARGLYEQVVMEAGQQIAKNTDVAPKTLLGVLGTVFTEAVATVEGWRQGAPIDGPMVTNLRATMANRLLPDPAQNCARCTHPFSDHENGVGRCLKCDCEMAVGIKAARKRDGKAGDSAYRPDPRVPHIYEYPLSASPDHCAVPECGRPFGDPIHMLGTGWSAVLPHNPKESR